MASSDETSLQFVDEGFTVGSFVVARGDFVVCERFAEDDGQFCSFGDCLALWEHFVYAVNTNWDDVSTAFLCEHGEPELYFSKIFSVSTRAFGKYENGLAIGELGKRASDGGTISFASADGKCSEAEDEGPKWEFEELFFGHKPQMAGRC